MNVMARTISCVITIPRVYSGRLNPLMTSQIPTPTTTPKMMYVGILKKETGPYISPYRPLGKGPYAGFTTKYLNRTIATKPNR